MTHEFIPFPQGARVCLTYSDGVHTPVMHNYLHHWTYAGFGGFDLEALVNLYVLWDTQQWSNIRHQGMFLIGVDAIALDSNSGPQYSRSLENTHPGHIGGAGYDWGLTKSIIIETAFRGHSQQGQIFVPLLSQLMCNGPNNVSLPWALEAVACIDDLIDRAKNNVTPYPLVVASYRHNKQWREQATWQYAIRAGMVNYRINNLRRRLRAWE